MPSVVEVAPLASRKVCSRTEFSRSCTPVSVVDGAPSTTPDRESFTHRGVPHIAPEDELSVVSPSWTVAQLPVELQWGC